MHTGFFFRLIRLHILDVYLNSSNPRQGRSNQQPDLEKEYQVMDFVQFRTLVDL